MFTWPVVPYLELLSVAVKPQLYKIAMSGTLVPVCYHDLAGGVRDYLAPLDDYLNHDVRGAEVFLAGHSLGGGIAKIMGARQGLFPWALEGPGVVMPGLGMPGLGVFQSEKLQFEWEQFNNAFNVRAQGDAIAWTGIDIGMTQDVSCAGVPTQPIVACHLTVASVLLQACGTAGTPFASPLAPDGTLDYCPNLPDTMETLDAQAKAGLTLVATPRNIYQESWATAQVSR